MAYFNYHAKVKRLILDGKCVGAEIKENYHGISPALVLYFSNNIPMPIRSYMWHRYIDLLLSKGIEIKNL